MVLNLRPSARPLQQTKPRLGMTLAFKPASSETLADIPARVVEIWPRFRSGDYLVKLEYAQPVKCGGEIIRHIDAFFSELYQPGVSTPGVLPARTQARQPAELLNSTPHITRGLAHQRFCAP